jgi:hypothetical protein
VTNNKVTGYRLYGQSSIPGRGDRSFYETRNVPRTAVDSPSRPGTAKSRRLRVWRYGLDDRDSISGKGSNGIFSLHRLQTDSRVHPAPYLMGTGVLSPGVERPESEALHSSPSSVEVKNACSYTSTHTSSGCGA